jgi:outer membrane protein OmpA-like peptidoglycan-associated protein
MNMRLTMIALATLAFGCAPPDRQLAARPAPTAAAVPPVAAAPGSAMRSPTADQHHWNVYREFNFNQGSAMVTAADVHMSAAIAAYAQEHPAAQFLVVGYRDAGSGMLSRRIDAARNSLIDAGVPAARIDTTALASLELRRDRVVQVELSDR